MGVGFLYALFSRVQSWIRPQQKSSSSRQVYCDISLSVNADGTITWTADWKEDSILSEVLFKLNRGYLFEDMIAGLSKNNSEENIESIIRVVNGVQELVNMESLAKQTNVQSVVKPSEVLSGYSNDVVH